MMHMGQGRKLPPATTTSDEELRNALKGLRRILNVIELDEAVGGIDHGGSDLLVFAQAMIAERARRYQFFNGHLFSDPAWDILLELFVAELEMREVPVTNLCLTSNVPDTTVLRWIKTLSFEGLVLRRKDKIDKRRVLVQLTRPAYEAMLTYVQEQIGATARLHAVASAASEKVLPYPVKVQSISN